MARTIRGTLATHAIPGTDQHGRVVTQLRIAVTPHVERLRRGERREDYIRIVLVHLIGHLPHAIPVGAPVVVTLADRTASQSGRAAYTAAADAFAWR